jgi:hypothetical protein
MSCGVTSDGFACQNAAEAIITSGGKFNVSICGEHLAEFRQTWAATEDQVLPLPPPEASTDTPWGQGKSSGARWAAERAQPEELAALVKAAHDPQLYPTFRFLNAASDIENGLIPDLTTLGDWVRKERPADLNSRRAQHWLAGFVHGATAEGR